MKKDDSNNEKIKELTFLFTFRESNKVIKKKFMFLINCFHIITQQPF